MNLTVCLCVCVSFGVAHVQSFSSGNKPLVCNLASGTKQYLAPEVFTKDHVHGAEADFYGLGVVAYELLFGRRPFDKHCTDLPPPPSLSLSSYFPLHCLSHPCCSPLLVACLQARWR